MKTTKITLIALLFSITLTAQVKQGFEIGTQGGYEYNYFKSPKEVQQGGVIFTEKDLIESSIYQDIDLAYNYRNKWEKNRIRFSVSPFSRLYYENINDSYWSLAASAKYDYRINKNTKFLSEASVKRMNRKGLDGDQDVLINPLGYTNYGLEAGVGFQPLENNKTTATVFYNFKNFDEYGIRNLQFSEYGVQLKTTQEFEVNKLEHKYGLAVYVKKRKYDAYNALAVVTDSKRVWNYVRINAFYEYPISKTLEIKPGFVYYARIDSKDKRSGFSQFGPAIGLKFDNKKTRLRSSFKYLTRNYSNLEAKDNNGLTGEKIQYNYADITFDAEHRLNDNLLITATVYSRIRNTNYTDLGARSFRGYRNQYIGIGVKWEL